MLPVLTHLPPGHKAMLPGGRQTNECLDSQSHTGPSTHRLQQQAPPGAYLLASHLNRQELWRPMGKNVFTAITTGAALLILVRRHQVSENEPNKHIVVGYGLVYSSCEWHR
ncbi:hypothetical protein RRG08_028428 [Elysia crispata]|uniref:Uncharacterized protein n=1 Tax=Elysia crispata TaxID=231223 RepID=A0AAE1E4E0_9GAST|nr:hypothetical protein RRG08_028428 [Elysia crispata]